MSRALTEVGFYGKLPCRGDFLQRRAPQDFVDAWDAWLQESLHALRARLEDRWLDTYLTGPVWRFALSPGVCGAGTYIGILVPSVDRVGRYFPLTVLAQLEPEDCVLAVACASRVWFETAEHLVLDALDAEALDFDTFDEQVALLRERLDTASATESSQALRVLGNAPAPAGRWQMPLASAASLQSAVNAYAHREAGRLLAPLAIWWTEGSNTLRASWLCSRGLPEPAGFVGMLTGDWSATDWANAGGSS
ncbi:MAG TPA: type VI secretion system-associated protein TagF [Steroidobacteraceae bacterium]|nr:type VI secretion system-associated protein TagF [Steroidobacteraceae bacterium]